jgi:hypothetical protein
MRVTDEGEDSREPDGDRGIGERRDPGAQGLNLRIESASGKAEKKVRMELRQLPSENVDVELPAAVPVGGNDRPHGSVARGESAKGEHPG